MFPIFMFFKSISIFSSIAYTTSTLPLFLFSFMLQKGLGINFDLYKYIDDKINFCTKEIRNLFSLKMIILRIFNICM